MRENAKVAALVLAVGVAWAVPGVAQETTDEQTTEGATREHHKEHAEGGHEAYRNSLGFFLGVTDEPGHDLEGTWGLEYTRLVARRWGVGAVGEYAGGDLRNTVLIAFGAWTPWKDLELFAGPGVEFHDGRSSGEPHRESGGEGDSDNDKT